METKVKIINLAFDLNIQPRGELQEYFNILRILKLEEPFSKEELIEKIILQKRKEFEFGMDVLVDKMYEI